MAQSERSSCFFCNRPVFDGVQYCPHCGKKQPEPFSDKEIEKDPYEILQVSKNAEPEVIKAAYKGLARKYHPDVNDSKLAQERMQEINWAFDILNDQEKRRNWDKTAGKNEGSYRSRAYRQQESPKKSKQTSQRLRSIECQNCGFENDPNRNYCQQCWHELSRSTDTPPKSTTQPSTQWSNDIECPHCGFENSPKRLYCEECGYGLSKTTDSKPQTSSDWFPVIFGIGIIFIFVAAIVSVFAPRGNSPSNFSTVATQKPTKYILSQPTVTPNNTVIPKSTLSAEFIETRDATWKTVNANLTQTALARTVLPPTALMKNNYVPDVMGLSRLEAIVIMDNSGLEFVEINSHNPDTPLGIVFNQDPKGGELFDDSPVITYDSKNYMQYTNSPKVKIYISSELEFLKSIKGKGKGFYESSSGKFNVISGDSYLINVKNQKFSGGEAWEPRKGVYSIEINCNGLLQSLGGGNPEWQGIYYASCSGVASIYFGGSDYDASIDIYHYKVTP